MHVADPLWRLVSQLCAGNILSQTASPLANKD